MKFKLSKYVHIANDDDILPDHSILYMTRTGLAIEILRSHVSMLQQGLFDLLPLDTLKKMIRFQVLVDENENELETVLQENKAEIKDSEVLSFTIQPTANCQLGCHYCGQVHSKKVMKDEISDLVIERIIGKIEEKKDVIKRLHISWYGGEPITGLSSIIYASERLMKVAKDYGLQYSADMVTNGLALKEKIFEDLVANHKIMQYQITIDGTAEYHDKRRMLKTGTPSFDLIFSNVSTIAKSKFYQDSGAKINVRCNVDSENKENVLELIGLLHEVNVLDKVGFYIAAIHDWGDNNASKINGITTQDFAQFEIEVFMELAKYNQKVGLLPTRKNKVCMVVSDTSEVFDALGNVSTCWDVPYTPIYENTPFVSGNLMQGEKIDTSTALMRQWYDEIPTNQSWCKNCKFLPVCGGGCPKEWHFGTPACPPFKFNIDERLFLQKFNAQSSLVN